MRIIIGMGASEPYYTTGKSLIRAFKALGHDICTAGPVYGRTALNVMHSDTMDIDLPDKPYPETYTYKEILDRAPWTPDFILQIEPHFYLIGQKPKGINSYYWVLDPHRGGIGHRNMARSGNFNAIFISQKAFVAPYITKGMQCYWLPQAVDIERIRPDKTIQEKCDLAFIGETGIHKDHLIYDKLDADGYEYLTGFDTEDIRMWSPYGEYAERGILLVNLCKDFDVRIYKKQWGVAYTRIIQKGRIGFHRSLFNDIAMRVFEIMACKRALLTDRVENIDELMEHLKHVVFYKQFGYDPRLPNFMLDYEMVKQYMIEILSKNNVRDAIAGEGYRHVKTYHTYKRRAEFITAIFEKDKKEQNL